MATFLKGHVFVVAGLLATPTVSALQAQIQVDPRLGALQSFFSKYNCPAREYAADFLIAADQHALDWRLLPSISLVESGGGREGRKNNIFGWDSARSGFTSVRTGIYKVAEALARGDMYRNKDLDGKLKTYNPLPTYAPKVKALMRSIGPAQYEAGLTATVN